MVHSFKFKFNIHINDLVNRPTYNIDFGVWRNYRSFYRINKICFILRPIDSKYLKWILALLNYIIPIKIDAWFYFNYLGSSFMCIAFLDFLQRNMKLVTHYFFLLLITYNIWVKFFEYLIISTWLESSEVISDFFLIYIYIYIYSHMKKKPVNLNIILWSFSLHLLIKECIKAQI